MAITFNDTWTTFSWEDNTSYGIWFYDASAGTYTRRTGTTFDLFPDDVAVDDCLYFVQYNTYPQFNGLKLNVTTPLVASSITGVWQYHRIASFNGPQNWYDLSGVTDGTNAFQTGGTNTVTFTCPTDWENRGYTLSNAVNTVFYCFAIRFKVTAVDTPTEGGACLRSSLQTLPYWILVSDGTTGTPKTFTDIYNADVAGGWGVVTKNNKNFNFDTNLYLPSGYYLSSTSEIIQFAINWQMSLTGVVRFGTLYSGDKVYAGSTFIFNLQNRDLTTGRLSPSDDSYIYNTTFRCVSVSGDNQGYWGTPGASKVSMYDCFFDGFRQCVFSKSTNAVIGIKARCHIEGDGSVIAEGSQFGGGRGWRITSSPISYVHKMDFAQNTTSPFDAYLYNNDNVNKYAVDCKLGTFTYDKYCYWNDGSGTNNKIWCVASIQLKVVDKDNSVISGATVKLVDKDGTEIFSLTTNTDGYIGSDNGSMSGASSSSISDTSKSWTQDLYRWREVLITSGSGVGQRRYIPAQTGTPYTTLPVAPNFVTTPSANDRYIIIPYVSWLKVVPATEESSATVTSSYTSYNPFTLTISKSGYKTYKSTFTLDKAFDQVITLEKLKDNNFSSLARVNTR